MAPDHCAEALSVPPDAAVPIGFTVRSRAYTLALLLAVVEVVCALATELKLLEMLPSVGALLI